MLTLKNYQQRALSALTDYFELVSRTNDADTAFYQLTRELYERGQTYNPIPQLRALPYVCLRIPTGGGKTLLACHSIRIAAHMLLRQEHVLVLWLVPTKTIKDQTLTALRDRTHPYRQALDTTLDARVTVMDLTESLSVQRTTLDSTTTIIVSTLAAPRVEDTDSRKLYEANGALLSHFDGLPDAITANLEKYENTNTPIPSLANVLKMRRPLVLVDEAHNARTELAFDTLARFSPSAILEFSATPTKPPAPNASNVLYHVSAYELKAEDMIKLPIHLQTHTDWRDAVSAAIGKRAELELLANGERDATGDYIRPIVLFQAQPHHRGRETLTVDVIRQALLDLDISEAQIAIETGEQREVKEWEDAHKKTLFSETCPIRFIITVQALREGWDCPFAYVLCSVAESRSSTAVEQILGRVLRLPKARRRQHEELNSAYAFVSSQKFREAAEDLADALIKNGFTQFEAETEIAAHQPTFGGAFDGLPLGAIVERNVTPAEQGRKLSVPQLALWVNGVLEVVEESHFLDTSWELAKCDATLNEDEYSIQHRQADALDLNVDKHGTVTMKRVDHVYASALQEQLQLLAVNVVPTPANLAVWLDSHIPHPDITQTQTQIFLGHMIDSLVKERGLSMADLARDRYRLCDAASKKIETHRNAVIKREFQRQMFGNRTDEIQVSPECVFTYDPNRYAANRLYDGGYPFRKHYYRAVGWMDSEEEAGAAEVIDRLDSVQYWVKNIPREPNQSFWLQTSTGKFYPDFVALLTDGRVLVVEYKGAHLLEHHETVEKKMVGELWAARSKGKCLFLMVGADDYAGRLQAIA